MVMERGIGEKIMLLPGREFMARREDHCPYLRAAFSVIPEDEMDEVCAERDLFIILYYFLYSIKKLGLLHVRTIIFHHTQYAHAYTHTYICLTFLSGNPLRTYLM